MRNSSCSHEAWNAWHGQKQKLKSTVPFSPLKCITKFTAKMHATSLAEFILPDEIFVYHKHLKRFQCIFQVLHTQFFEFDTIQSVY